MGSMGGKYWYHTNGYGIESAAIYDVLTQGLEVRMPKVWYGFSPERGWGWFYREHGIKTCVWLGETERQALIELRGA